jgi:hypothetical protein
MAQRPRGIETKDRMDFAVAQAHSSRGGSLSVEPAVLIPVGSLEKTFGASPGIDLNFDVGISPRLSVVFGGGAFDLVSKTNPDLRFRLLPAWLGVRFKYRLAPIIETYWEASAAGYYEYLTYQNDVDARQDHLAPGGIFTSGFHVWFTSWLLAGIQSRLHFIEEDGRIFPMVQFGLMVGIRGGKFLCINMRPG